MRKMMVAVLVVLAVSAFSSQAFAESGTILPQRVWFRR